MHDENRLSIFEHLDELRGRLIFSAVTILVGFLVCFTYSEYLLYLLKFPLNNQIELSLSAPVIRFVQNASEVKLFFISPAEAFWSHMKIAIICSIIVSCPVIITQVWLFVKPALFKDERKLVLPFILISILLFIVGLFFCSLIVLPFALDFLLGYKTEGLVAILTLEHYIDFTLRFILAFGVVFQTPVIIVLLVRLNILRIEMLKRNRKYAVLVIFIVAAVLTPTPDIFNQCLMAVPLMILYELSILFAGLLYKDH